MFWLFSGCLENWRRREIVGTRNSSPHGELALFPSLSLALFVCLSLVALLALLCGRLNALFGTLENADPFVCLRLSVIGYRLSSLAVLVLALRVLLILAAALSGHAPVHHYNNKSNDASWRCCPFASAVLALSFSFLPSGQLSFKAVQVECQRPVKDLCRGLWTLDQNSSSSSRRNKNNNNNNRNSDSSGDSDSDATTGLNDAYKAHIELNEGVRESAMISCSPLLLFVSLYLSLSLFVSRDWAKCVNRWRAASSSDCAHQSLPLGSVLCGCGCGSHSTLTLTSTLTPTPLLARSEDAAEWQRRHSSSPSSSRGLSLSLALSLFFLPRCSSAQD